MGVFGDHFRKYYEHGFNVLPCNNKKPICGQQWQVYCNEKITDELADQWEKSYETAQQIGLALGAVNGLCAFDFDFEFDKEKCKIKKQQFDKDRKMIEQQIIALLPPTPCIKVGKKGWTRIYRMHSKLENVQCDKYNVRLFDFLARNKQTIIPPSAYNDSDIKYRWIGEPIENCMEDIPFITQETVDEIKSLFSEGGGFEFNGRHGVLFKWLLDVARLEKDSEKLADLLVARDKLVNPKPYLSDKTYFPRTEARENALVWIKRVKKFMSVDGTKEQIKLGEFGWNYFFENSFKHIKKDIMSKDVFIKRDDKEPWIIIKAVEDVLMAYAQSKGMPYSQTGMHLARWVFEKTDLEYLCELPEWDGIDRVKMFSDCIVSTRFTHDEIAEILKQWGVNVFRRIDSSDNQNRAIVFKGKQGIGKDYLFRAMFRDFKPYYDSTTLPGTQKDVLEIVSRLLIVHIEEFDQTKNLDVAFIKSLITQPSAFFRESYGHSPNQKMMRPNFISTANVDDFLRDPTGNRRFIVIPVDDIKWEYPKDQSLQVMAQFKSLHGKGEYYLSKDIEDKIKEIIEEYTPDDTSESIVDLYKTRFGELTRPGMLAPYAGREYLRYSEIAEAISKIAKDMNCSVRRVQSVLKSAGLTKRYRDGIKCFVSKEFQIDHTHNYKLTSVNDV